MVNTQLPYLDPTCKRRKGFEKRQAHWAPGPVEAASKKPQTRS
jgi:hypothetical protein